MESEEANAPRVDTGEVTVFYFKNATDGAKLGLLIIAIAMAWVLGFIVLSMTATASTGGFLYASGGGIEPYFLDDVLYPILSTLLTSGALLPILVGFAWMSGFLWIGRRMAPSLGQIDLDARGLLWTKSDGKEVIGIAWSEVDRAIVGAGVISFIRGNADPLVLRACVKISQLFFLLSNFGWRV